MAFQTKIVTLDARVSIRRQVIKEKSIQEYGHDQTDMFDKRTMQTEGTKVEVPKTVVHNMLIYRVQM